MSIFSCLWTSKFLSTLAVMSFHAKLLLQFIDRNIRSPNRMMVACSVCKWIAMFPPILASRMIVLSSIHVFSLTSGFVSMPYDIWNIPELYLYWITYWCFGVFLKGSAWPAGVMFHHFDLSGPRNYWLHSSLKATFICYTVSDSPLFLIDRLLSANLGSFSNKGHRDRLPSVHYEELTNC